LSISYYFFNYCGHLDILTSLPVFNAAITCRWSVAGAAIL